MRHDDGDATKNIRCVWSTFNKTKRAGRMSDKRKQVDTALLTLKAYYLSSHQVVPTLIQTHREYGQGKANWLRLIVSYLLTCRESDLKSILPFVYTYSGPDKRVQDIIKDLIVHLTRTRYELNPQTKKKGRSEKNVFFILSFINKGIEKIGLERILREKNTVSLVPKSFRYSPIISYRYTKPIRNKIFNYQKALKCIDKFNHIPCVCNHLNNKFKKNGHVFTGDLNVVPNHDLRWLLSKGPTYRPPVSIDLDAVRREVESKLDDFVNRWYARERVTEGLGDWKVAVMNKVDDRLDDVRNRLRMRREHRMTNVMEREDVMRALRNVHRHFVLVPADKAANNVIVVCKRFYVHLHRIRLGLDSVSGELGMSHYLKVDDVCEEEVVNRIVSREEKRGWSRTFVEGEPKNKELPYIYGTPKMHKKPVALRFIAASHRCVTKQLENTITKGLKLLLRQHRIYCNTVYRRTKVKRMWIIDNSQRVLDKIDTLNESRSARNLHTYDFSTLYDNVQHEDLKREMNWVIDFCFKDKPNKRLYIDLRPGRMASWRAPGSTIKRNSTLSLTKEDFHEIICFLIDNSYVKIGQHIFRQIRGIPMGTSCSPFLANLYLYSKEFAFLEKLMKTESWRARTLSQCFRFIDDLCSFNSDLSPFIKDIYPPELKLVKTNTNSLQCTFLDIKMDVDEKKGTVATNLFDKRDDFSFPIVNFPFLSSNIHFKRSHGVFVSQLLRFVRVMNCGDFVSRARRLASQLCSQGFSETILRRKFSAFYHTHYHLVSKYKASRKKLIKHIFDPH